MNIILADENSIKELAHTIFTENYVVSLTRLGGLTNRSYCVVLDNGKKYVFRIPGKGTNEIINRQHEKISTNLAYKLKIDVDLLYFCSETGIKISRYIDNAQTMSPLSMQKNKNFSEAANLLKTLHNSGFDTGIPFKFSQMVETYEKFIQLNNGNFYEDYGDIRCQVMQLKNKTDKSSPSFVPCHNDPLCENWICDDSRMYLIDWEYAGMNDPFWDLADMSIETGMNDDMDTTFLTYYLDQKPTVNEFFCFMANKIYLDFLWSLWGKTRVPFNGYPMEQYSLERYLRLKNNLLTIKALYNLKKI